VLKFECERENIRANNERAYMLPNERLPMHAYPHEMKRHQDWLA